MLTPRPRCAWAGADGPKPDPLMVAYHDDEWGRPVHDDIELFERLALESFQAGLSWSTILRKRDAFRAAFRGFDPAVVAGFDDADRERLMADAGIVRNRRQDRRDDRQRGGRSWRPPRSSARSTRTSPTMVPPPPTRLPPTARPGDIPATTPASDALSADLERRGFRFVGSTIVYAFMQSVGLVDDHLPGCFRYREATLSRRPFAGWRSEVAPFERPGRDGEHDRDPGDRPDDEGQRRWRGGVERVRIGQLGRAAGRDEHDQRRLEPVDHAAP